MSVEATAIERGRAIPIERELTQRGIRLRRVGAELVGPCPVCGGEDRFGANTRKQIWNCRGCARGGDVIALVMHIDGTGFAEAVRTLRGEPAATATEWPVERPSAVPAVEAVDEQKMRRLAAQLWREAVTIEGTLAEQYLVGLPAAREGPRGLILPEDVSPRVLRYHARCPFDGERRPCLIALYHTIDGDRPVAIHRTALTEDGRKATLAKPKLSLGATSGAAVKLSPDDEVSASLTIAEGIETTLAGMMFGFRPAWALGSAGAIRKFPVLAGIKTLTILVDHDPPDRNGRRAGPDAARKCVDRWVAAGREVLLVQPRQMDEDLADIRSAS